MRSSFGFIVKENRPNRQFILKFFKICYNRYRLKNLKQVQGYIMKKILNFLLKALQIVWELVRIAFILVIIAFSIMGYASWSREQGKVSNQYSDEEVNQELLCDVKEKLSEKYSVPVSNIRVVRNEEMLGLNYEYLVIIVDDEDYPVETFEIDDEKIQQEIDDSMDSFATNEELLEKYDIGEEEQ